MKNIGALAKVHRGALGKAHSGVLENELTSALWKRFKLIAVPWKNWEAHFRALEKVECSGNSSLPCPEKLGKAHFRSFFSALDNFCDAW